MVFHQNVVIFARKIRQAMGLWQNITLGRYYPSGSIIHRLDPRTKLILSLGMMLTIMLADSWPALLLWTFVLIVAILVTHIPLHIFVRNLRAFLWLFGITIFLHALTSSAAPDVEMWGISISGAGALIGVKYALRLGLLVLVAALLTSTTIPADLTDGLERMLHPLERIKFPAHELALMTMMALRFVPTIIEEAQRIQRAQISRGARFDGHLLQRVHALIPMLVPLFISTFKRADELAAAMEARCYRGGEGRVSFRELKLARADWIAIGIMLAAGLLTWPLTVQS